MDDIKQVIIIRMDLKMGTGIKCAQACHASITASNKVRRLNKKLWTDWINSGQKKVVLKAQSIDELMNIYSREEWQNLFMAVQANTMI